MFSSISEGWHFILLSTGIDLNVPSGSHCEHHMNKFRTQMNGDVCNASLRALWRQFQSWAGPVVHNGGPKFILFLLSALTSSSTMQGGQFHAKPSMSNWHSLMRWCTRVVVCLIIAIVSSYQPSCFCIRPDKAVIISSLCLSTPFNSKGAKCVCARVGVCAWVPLSQLAEQQVSVCGRFKCGPSVIDAANLALGGRFVACKAECASFI